MFPHKSLFAAILGFGLFAGATSAHAQLLMTFLEDAENGHLSIVFSGQATAIFAVTASQRGTGSGFTTNHAFTIQGSAESPVYISSLVTFPSPDILPLTGTYGSPVFTNGAGGFFRNGNSFQLASTTSAPIGSPITWDGILTYAGDLAGIGLVNGDFGALTFSNGTDSITINWDTAVIPEPSTYALMLGLGVVGVAVLRRHSRR